MYTVTCGCLSYMHAHVHVVVCTGGCMGSLCMYKHVHVHVTILYMVCLLFSRRDWLECLSSLS